MKTLSHKLYCKYEILNEPKLVLEFYRGALTLPLMKEYVHGLVSDPRYHMSINLLTDISELIYDGTLQDVEAYAQFLLELGEQIGMRKTAVVYSTPNQYTYAYVFVKLHEQFPHHIQLFNKCTDAIHWLGLEQSTELIENTFAEMKQEVSANKLALA